MRITYNALVTQYVTDMALRKRLKEVKRLALFTTTAGHVKTLEDFSEVLSKTYGHVPDLVSGCAKTSNTYFYFAAHEDKVIEDLRKLLGIVVPKKGTPPKVLVKMIYQRLVNLSVSRIQLAEYIKTADSRDYYMKFTTPEIDFEVMTNADRFVKSSPTVRHCAFELTNVVNRPDVTDEIRMTAWKMFTVNDTMNS